MPAQADFMVVVSGLPRSGTSLMMQMLAAGGLPVVSDGRRVPDPDNPRGYWEDQRVLNLAGDNAWLDDCQGRALKVVATHLPQLPRHLQYKIIFMQRRLEEMVASQNRMLARQGLPPGQLAGPQLAQALGRHQEQMLAWAQTQPHFSLLTLWFHQLVQDPHPRIQRVQSFLGLDLDRAAMAGAVDPALYRQRADG